MERSVKPHLGRLLAAFVVIAAALGVLAAGVALPIAASVGAATRATAEGFTTLGDDFSPVRLTSASKVLTADGKVLATLQQESRTIVPLKRISPIMRKAQLAIEDKRFYGHGGIDVRGTSRAFANNLLGQPTQGGSSISQQYVKMMFQNQALAAGDKLGAERAVAQTNARKLKELRYAINIEKSMTKDQILQGYMNLAFYGDGAYGVESAARHYFNTSAKNLDYNQSALLAGIVQSPGRLDPVNHPADAQRRRDVVLSAMVDQGVITAEKADRARAVSVRSMLDLQPLPPSNCTTALDPFFCNYVRSYIENQVPELGPDPNSRWNAVLAGGMTIKTTLNYGLAQQLQRDLARRVPPGTPWYGAAAAAVEPSTGYVTAIAQNSRFTAVGDKNDTSATGYAWSLPQQYGGTQGFSIGSTAKMFNLVTAVEQGMTPSSSVYVPPAGPKVPYRFYSNQFQKDCTTNQQGGWPVRNDVNQGGYSMTLAQATAQSVNTAFASLASKVGSCNISKTMSKFGFSTGIGTPFMQDKNGEWGGQKYGLNQSKQGLAIASLVLGVAPSTPLQVAVAYATLANGGKQCLPLPIKSITTSDGKKLDLSKPQCRQVISEAVAADTTKILMGTLRPGGTAGRYALAGRRVAAGKTGTAENHGQSYFAGYTPQLSTAVWVGQPGTETHPMSSSVRIGGVSGPIFGATLAAPIWKAFMDQALENKPYAAFRRPGGVGDAKVYAPSVIGMTFEQAAARLQEAGLNVVRGGASYSAGIRAGNVVAMDRSGLVPPGTTITLTLSLGPQAAPPRQQIQPQQPATPPRTPAQRPRTDTPTPRRS